MNKYLIRLVLEIADFLILWTFENKVWAIAMLILGVLTIIRIYKDDNPPSKADLVATCIIQLIIFYFVWLRYIKHW